jgi:exodeoxyribonuclease VII large subunit
MATRSKGSRHHACPPASVQADQGPAVRLGRTRATAIGVEMVVAGAALKLSQRFPDPLWVVGELVEVRPGPNGRSFAVLRGGSARIHVHVPPAIGRTATPPRPGVLVLVQGTLGIWTPAGSFRLEAKTPLFATDHAGVRAEARRAAECELRAEGIFDRATRALPEWPREVAVVSSPRGAAIHDIRAVISRRAPWTLVRLHECSVQGPAAAQSIVSAMEGANRTRADLIIVARGGGATDSLDAFDQPMLVRAVALSRLPVIVAVGHEPDTTLADLAADVSAPTPSAAAERAVPDRLELQRGLKSLRQRLDTAVTQGLQAVHGAHAELDARIRRSANRQMAVDRERLERLNPGRLSDRLQRFVRSERMQLDRQWSGLSSSIRLQLNNHRRELEFTGPAQFILRLQSRTVDSRARLTDLYRTIRALSPHDVLSRGFAMVLDSNNRLVRDLERLGPGSRLQVMLNDGVAAVVVETVTPRSLKENEDDHRE